MAWAKSIIHWREDDKVYVSVVFTWHLPLAKKLCQWNQQAGLEVHAGGPAVDLMPEYLVDVTAHTSGQMTPLPLTRHNPDATFTTRGCIRECHFCAVPKTEGCFRELTDWTPAPIICDNNLLAASQKHFDTVIDKVKVFKGVDFNQGLDARLLNDHHIERLKELRVPKLRFAFDNITEEKEVTEAVNAVLAAGFPKSRITVFCLIGHSDTPEDALYRLVYVRDVLGVTPFPMRFQPLYTLKFNDYVAPGWTDKELRRMMRYWARQNWTSKIPYSEFEG